MNHLRVVVSGAAGLIGYSLSGLLVSGLSVYFMNREMELFLERNMYCLVFYFSYYIDF